MSTLEDEYRLEYFSREGFERKQCSGCAAYFWTRDHDRVTCGEPPCEQYGFIDNPGFDEEYSLEEMRERFLSFFEDHDHTRISPYPVAANRWRDDVLLTQASIYDFQPLVTSGETPPPANPLCISQPCIRMQDIDNVGKTGRHTMAFEMMAHHAFNVREDAEDEYAYSGEVYWKDETVEYCDLFLADLGVDLEDVTYIEDPWVGGGNAGPAFEVIYRGVELATLVFMSLEQDPEGSYELKDGNRYSPMDTYIVDTGYGLERWTWVSQGTPTIYEAVYPEMIETLKGIAGVEYSSDETELIHRAAKRAGYLDIDEAEDMGSAREVIADELGIDPSYLEELMGPLEVIYAIADHCRTLAYMFGDGIVPSNVGTGYLSRMVLRRTKRLCETVGVDAPLDELVDMQSERLGYDNRDVIRAIVRSEVEKYAETLERGGRRVRQIAQEYSSRDEPIPTEELIELYDSHGIQPDMVEEIADEFAVEVSVPRDFYSRVAGRHESSGGRDGEERAVQSDRDYSNLPKTERLYYDDQERMEFEAVVLDVFENSDGYDVVLDQTMFYPEGGGQPADRGSLSTDDETVEVTDVQLIDGVILHRTDGNPGKGEFVRGRIDIDRRYQLMRNHTATHIIIHAARQILGDHVRQAGAQKGVRSSRIDIRHYQRISRGELKQIERLANEIVTNNSVVKQEWPHRHEAEEEYGFDLYQGGIPPGTNIRLIHVAGDTQACAGTHVSRTGDIGAIKVLRTERVQDGVERIVFAAGSAAIKAVQELEDTLLDAADTFDVSPSEVASTAERFFEEWKERGKQIDELTRQLAETKASSDQGNEITVGDATVVVRRIDVPSNELRATANAIVDDGRVAVLASGVDDAQFVVAVPESVNLDAGDLVGELAEMVGGGGGGPSDFAQGGGPDVSNLDEVLDRVPELVNRVFNA